MNLGELVEVSRAKYMGATHGLKAVSFNEAFAKTAINMGYRRVERAALWSFGEAEVDDVVSVADQYTLSNLPSDLGQVLTLYDSDNNFELTYFDDRQGVLDTTTESKAPYRYSEWGGALKVWPKPTKVVTYLLRYYKTWAELSLDADEPIIPEAFHEILASYAARVLVLRTPPEGDRFLPASAAEPFNLEWQEGMASMLQSPLTLKSLDAVPYEEHMDLFYEGAGRYW